jgi:hypothetical protein
VSSYKAAMGQKDCVHFDFGEGTCPFGTSCFYRHAYKDGRLEVRTKLVPWKHIVCHALVSIDTTRICCAQWLYLLVTCKQCRLQAWKLIGDLIIAVETSPGTVMCRCL